jgi:hypothetical protein
VHEKHLEAYWPIFLFASVGEAAAYILLDPSLFTLVVFLKTTATTAVWLTTRSDGSMVRLSSIIPKRADGRADVVWDGWSS